MATWTNTELLAAIRRRARLSSSDPDYTDANLLLDADQQLDETLVPLILGARSDYYATTADQAITASQAAYPIPSRAVASVVRQVHVVNSAGELREIEFLPLGDRHLFPTSGEPRAYTVLDDEVILLPTPSTTTGTLRITYEYQPGLLVASTAVALVTAIDTGTGDVTGANVPAAWTTSDTFDFVKGTSPYKLLAAGLTASSVTTGASGDITFTVGDLPSRLAVGDYVCLTGEAPMPMIPADLHGTLAMAVAAEVLDQMGDPMAAAMRAKLGQALAAARRKLSPRVKGSPQPIVSRNSALRTRRGRRWAATQP